jgi:multimeric flavodoxin WrbA
VKILILNGSPHKKGVTATILRAIAEGASAAGKDVEWVNVYDQEIKACRGCLRCRPDSECILPEDGGHELARKIHDADALVVGTPTYWGNVSGPLKTLFDRTVPVWEFIGEGLPKPVQKGKRAAIVVTSSAPWPLNQLAYQSRGAVRAVRTVLRSGGYRIVGTINAPGKSGQPVDVSQQTRERAKRLGDRL